MHSVVQLQAFRADAKATGMSADEVFDLVSFLAANPAAGEVMVGTGGARKLRWARPGMGKSSGYRIVTYYAGVDVPVFLLAAYAKGDRANLSKAERNDLADILRRIAAPYRKGPRP